MRAQFSDDPPPQTFNSVDDTAGPVHHFEVPAHLVMTGRYSDSPFHEFEIIFKKILAPGEPTTRDAILRFRGHTSEQLYRNFGINPVADDLGDPITILTARSRAHNAWVTSGDVKIRFLTKEIAVDIWHQQRDSPRASITGAGYLADSTGLRCPTIIPPGLPKGDA